MSEHIGFIGLGNMGLPIANNLLDAGYALSVYNRTSSKANPLIEKGAQRATRPVDAVMTGGIVVTLIWDDAAVESIVMSDGFLEKLGQNGIHVAMSSVLPQTSRRLAALHAEHGSTYIDAPLFGAPDAATTKQLFVPFSGPQEAKERTRALLTAMGVQRLFDFGEEVGVANSVKLVVNFLVFSANYSLREALSTAEKNGADPQVVVDLLTSTWFPGPVYQTYGKMIAEHTATFDQNAIPLKDVHLLKKVAQQVDSPTAFANLLLDLMRSDTGKA